MASGGGKRKLGANKKKPTNIAYKAQDRLSKNKKLRAKRHEKRMEAQTEKCLERYNLGKPISSKLKRKLDFNAAMAYEA